MSHEIRTPRKAIEGFSNQLTSEHTSRTEENKEIASIIDEPYQTLVEAGQ
jgi:hypothetical protein